MPFHETTAGTSAALVPASFRLRRLRLSLAAALLLAGGCATHRPPTTAPTTTAPALDGTYREDLEVAVDPPAGWTARPVEKTSNSLTQVWVSPTGATALGVIRFQMPLPVGHDWALWGFLKNMQRSEGRAELLEKRFDESERVLRFVAEGGRYRVRTKMTVRGVFGWAIFAGTKTDMPIDEAELRQAESARDAVRIAR